MSSAKYLPILFGIPALLYLFIWMIRASQLGTAFPLFDHDGRVVPGGDIIYGGLFPGDFTIDPIFGLVALLVALVFYKGINNLLAAFKSQPKTFVVGHKPKSFTQCLVDTLKGDVAQHTKFQECGSDKKERFQGHLLVFYAFIALGIVTSIVAVAHWGGKVVPFLAPVGHTPMALYNPVKILANVGAIALVTGLTFLTRRRLDADPTKAGSSFYDWYLLGVIWAIALTGIFSELLRLAGVAGLAYPMYYLHLIAVFMLIAYLPWSKLGHLVYRTVALAYARYIGRIPA
jgi:quinone-modifying oxidoreductase subunit QmoC